MKEKWSEYYTLEQLKKIQEIEIESLKVFINFCSQEKLEYFLYGGTLLGAVRNNKMIPWDDDIDVAMPRNSYEKFIRLANVKLPNGWFIQTPYNCRISPFPYIKLRRKGTKFVEEEFKDLNMDSGIYIDIYPVDKIPDDNNLYRRQFKKVRRLILLYVLRQAPLYRKKDFHKFGFLRRFLKFSANKVLKIIPQKKLMCMIDAIMTKYNNTDSKRYAALNSPNINNIYLNLYPFENGKFENLDIVLPGDYKTHLTMRYGDWSKLPANNKRLGHIPYILEFNDCETNKVDYV